jgi:PhnB protein
MPNKSAETLGGSPISLFIYVENVDEAFKRAVAAGCTVTFPVSEMFWGDRAGHLKDPFGYDWMIATHKRDMTKDEIRREAEAFFSMRK